MMTTTMMMNVT